MHHCPLAVVQQDKAITKKEAQRHACKALNHQAKLPAHSEPPACPHSAAGMGDPGPAGRIKTGRPHARQQFLQQLRLWLSGRASGYTLEGRGFVSHPPCLVVVGHQPCVAGWQPPHAAATTKCVRQVQSRRGPNPRVGTCMPTPNTLAPLAPRYLGWDLL